MAPRKLAIEATPQPGDLDCTHPFPVPSGPDFLAESAAPSVGSSPESELRDTHYAARILARYACRFDLDSSRREKENTYALGEQVAEIGSCYVCRELGVPAVDMTNHIAYVGNWLQAMRSDPRFIFIALAQAGRAADYLLSFPRKPADVPVPDDELITAPG